MSFAIKQGTNISHWLSQSKKRGAERRAFFTQDDVKRLADWGFDHLRLPIDEEQMWREDGAKETEAFDLLDGALDWAAQAGLRVIVDLHVLRSHYFNDANQPSLFTDPREAEKFGDLWTQLSDHLQNRNVDQVAYEFLNEAVAQNDQDWNRVAHLAWKTVRNREKSRFVLLGSNRFNSAGTYDALSVPKDDRLILTFHFYNPMLITHHAAKWWRQGGFYEGPVNYPGRPVSEDQIAALPEPGRSEIVRNNAPYDRAAMLRDIAKPLAKRAQTGNPLHCGEFGVYGRTPDDVRERWYRDIIAVFREQDIAWSNWDYKGSFGIVDADGRETGVRTWLMA